MFDSVKTRRLAHHPCGRANGSDSEMGAGGGAMRQLDTFSAANEVDRMLAGIVATAQGLDADRALGPRASFSCTLEDDMIL